MHEEQRNDSTMVGAAKAIGKAAGKLAKLTSAVSHETAPPRQTKGRLEKKNKARLPRRQKKAARKKAPKAA